MYILDKGKIVYRLLYITGVSVFLTTVFMEELELDLVLKPLFIIILSYIYILNSEKVNYFVLVSMLILMITKIFVLLDFGKYFKYITILYALHYIINIFLLWESVLLVKMQVKKFFTAQLLITMILIGYVLYSATNLIIPSIVNDQVYLIVFVICFMLFISFCYYIYLNSKTVVSSSLMVAASCFLIVNTVMAVNEFYIQIQIFAIMASILQMFGEFFLIKFFTEQQHLSPYDEEYF